VRNQEAARYARWAAMAAGLIALLVVAIYTFRAISEARHRDIPARVAASVQRQMQTFSYNGMEKNRTIFTIRASLATQFKGGNAALLEDVWISIHGRDGDRNDNIHTSECTYAQETGAIQCKGAVNIDIQPAKPSSGGAVADSLHITTSNLKFDGQTGEASTPAPVEFSLPQGHGHGVGVSYSTRTAIVRIEHAVEFDMAASRKVGGLPLGIRADSLEVRRDDRKVLLAGPVMVRQGDRELSAGNVTISLDQTFHAQEALAEGRPSVRVAHGGDRLEASAATLEADLNPEGGIERIEARGNVTGSRQTATGSSHFSSDRVEFSLEPSRNVLRQMTATGSVVAESEQSGVFHSLKTTALRLNFTPGAQPDQQHVNQAETLGPSTILVKDPSDTTELRGPTFTAQFGENNRLGRLLGRTVEIKRIFGHSPPQISTAQRLNAYFSSDGEWSRVEETGDVKFEQGDRQASAQRAEVDRTDGQVILTGSPVISDSLSRTTAAKVTLDQKSGEFAALGGVLSTYLPPHDKPVNATAEAAHIAAARLSGSTSSGRVVYSGSARLWQGKSVLEADQIAISRNEKEMHASGNVIAVFPQTSGPGIVPVSQGKAPGPILWEVRAPELTYSSDQAKANLLGGVRITSGQVSLGARAVEIDLFAGDSPASGGSSLPGGQLSRVVAEGDVVVRQGLLRATSETATYTASDGKFVLSGGQPTITDASGNSTSGRSLTFFLPNDTILIDSQEGSRTLTKHRVEK
jgi:lipopolysaccharide export system protein LptA